MRRRIRHLFATAMLVITTMLPQVSQGAGTPNIIRADLFTLQDGRYKHPAQVSLVRTLRPGGQIRKTIRGLAVPAQQPWALAPIPGTGAAYISDRADGSIWEMELESGRMIRQFKATRQPSTDLRGVAVSENGESLFLYYSGHKLIQKTDRFGQVLAEWPAPTPYAFSLWQRYGVLYLLEDRGIVHKIDAESGKLMESIALQGPRGERLSESNSTFTLFWDGRYWNVANARDNWKLYRFDELWRYHDQIDLQMWSMPGAMFDGQEYRVLNNDSRMIYTFRLTDDVEERVETDVTEHYQYVETLLTTPSAASAYPQYDERNLLLLYNSENRLTPQFLRPHVSYLNEAGKSAGTMFDSFVLLPTAADGKAWFENTTNPGKWQEYRTNTMKDLAVLDAAWAKAIQEDPPGMTPARSTKAPFFLAVPYPSTSDTLDQGKAAIRDYIEAVYDQLGRMSFPNLAFRGFYWCREEVGQGLQERELVRYFNAYARAKGARTLWLPHFAEQTVPSYRELDFDMVLQQPNYYFAHLGYAQNKNRFYRLAESGKRWEHGLVMELDGHVLIDNASRQHFWDYLVEGSKLGFLGGSKAWYVDVDTIANLAAIKDPLYDAIHAALSGKLLTEGSIVTPDTEKRVRSIRSLSLPATGKVRIDLTTQAPYRIEQVVFTLDDPMAPTVQYVGTLGVDEELVLDGNRLVRQQIGQTAPGLRIGFNAPITAPVRVVLVPAGVDSPSLCIGQFRDVPDDRTDCSLVEQLAALGVINGYPDGTFQPDRTVTRAEMAVLIVRALGLQPNSRGSVPFTDAQAHWAATSGYLQAAIQAGALSGFPDGTFRPDDTVTRAQALTMVAAALGRKAEGVANYRDAGRATWFAGWTAAARVAGLIGDKAPYPLWDGPLLNPELPVIRQEVAAMVANFLLAR